LLFIIRIDSISLLSIISTDSINLLSIISTLSNNTFFIKDLQLPSAYTGRG